MFPFSSLFVTWFISRNKIIIDTARIIDKIKTQLAQQDELVVTFSFLC